MRHTLLLRQDGVAGTHQLPWPKGAQAAAPRTHAQLIAEAHLMARCLYVQSLCCFCCLLTGPRRATRETGSTFDRAGTVMGSVEWNILKKVFSKLKEQLDWGA
jgi:hypothetical protein